MKKLSKRTASLLAATAAVPLFSTALVVDDAAAQASSSAKSAGRFLPRHPAPFWGEGASFVGLSPTEDDFFWGLDVKGNAVFVSGDRGPAVGGIRQSFVAKFLTNGTSTLALDTSFGTGGIVNLDLSTYQGSATDPAVESARGVRVQPDGRVVVVGMVEDPADTTPDSTTPTVLFLARLNANGTSDASFGTGGVTVLDVGGALPSGGEGGAGDEAPWGLEIDATGRPLVSLSATADPARVPPGIDRDRYALRFTANGALDTSWGTAGYVSFDVSGQNNDNQRHGVVLPDGGLLSIGYTNLAGRNQVFVAKLGPTGAFDNTFSGDGKLRFTPFAVGFAEAYDAARLSDGSFVTTGYGNLYSETPPIGVPARGTDAVEFRITPDGSFDTGFGRGEHAQPGGGVALNVNNGNDRGRSITALGDDTLVVAGTAIPAGPTPAGNPEDAALYVLRPDGRLRNDFDPAGWRLFDFGGADEEFYGVEVGKIPGGANSQRFVVASGYSRQGSQANGQGVLVILPVPQRHVR